MRYFIDTLRKEHDLEQMIKSDKTEKVFTVVVQNSNEIKRIIWFLLERNAMFVRKSAGAGVAIFCVDMSATFFLGDDTVNEVKNPLREEV